MSKCPNCGREILNTAGPCVQCTVSIKKGEGVFNKVCSNCGEVQFLFTDTIFVVCKKCGRLN